MADQTITIEVVYALPEKQVLLSVEVPEHTTVIEAIELSGIRNHFDRMEVKPGSLGIFGVKTTPQTELRDGDRVEIYRPLIADPKEARRKRAEQAGS